LAGQSHFFGWLAALVGTTVGDHVGIPGVVVLFSFLLQDKCLGRSIPLFGWLAALACRSGLFGQLILIVLALLVIIAGSSVCPMV
jgi:hypothetical protein